MMGWYGGWGWGGSLVMGLMMLFFWGLIFAAVIAIVRSLRPGSDPVRSERGDARRLLDERFARGEIDEEDYRRRRDILTRR